MKNPFRKTTIYNLYVICAIASLGGLLFGIDVASMSAVIGTAAYKRQFHHPVTYHQGGIIAAMPFGAFFGALFSSVMADRMGRRGTIQFASLVWIVGCVCLCYATTITSLVLGRTLTGHAVGIASSVVPIYLSEMSRKEVRGRVVTFQQWATTWGILIQFFIQYGFSQMDGGPQNPNQSTIVFRLPWALQSIPAILLFIMMFFVPESPRWLAVQDNWTEAINILTKVHGQGNVNHLTVLAEFRQIEQSLDEETTSSYKALIEPRMLPRVILGVSIQSWSQLTGISTMMSYIVLIMETAGVRDPLLAASIQFIIYVGLTLPSFLILDKFGRRPALLYGSLVMLFCLLTIGLLQGSYGKPNPHTNPNLNDITWVMTEKVAAIFMIGHCYLFVGAYAMSWGPVSWIYPSEIYPSRIRAKAVSVATAFTWIFNFILAFAVPILLWYIKYLTFYLFAGFQVAAGIHMFLAAPETKDMSLEDMDDVFASGRPPWSRYRVGSRLDDIVDDMERNAHLQQPRSVQPTDQPMAQQTGAEAH